MINLNKLSSSFKESFDKSETIKDFGQFICDVENKPNRYCRNSAQYIKDVFDYYGFRHVTHITGEKIKRWNIFDKFGPVYGQELAQNQIYSYISSFSSNRINKIILLHGPNGASKTSIIKVIMDSMESYSKISEGAVFTFNWIFSDKGEKEESLGFSNAKTSYDPTTLAFTPPEDVTFKLACATKDNPILLIPKEQRQSFLCHLGFDPQDKCNQHLFDGDLSQKSQEIFNQLSVSYNGDWLQIMRHVQIERFYFSKLFRKGLVSIDPYPNTDASSRPLNLERSYRIPSILAMSSIHEPYGDLIDANRGICELSEIFKRRPDENKYLLTTAEWGTINLPGFTAKLDCVIFSTDNEKNLSAFKAHPDWPSFSGRLAYVKVPYILKWSDEHKVCHKLITEHNNDEVAPHTAKILSLWAIMTRLRRSNLDLDDAFGSTPDGVKTRELTHIEKAKIYNSQTVPLHLGLNKRKNLQRDIKLIATEYDDYRDRVLAKNVSDAAYEGRSGASYRDVETILVEATKKHTRLSPQIVFEAIEEISRNASVYEFIKLHDDSYESGYLSIPENLGLVKLEYSKMVNSDLKQASGLISDKEYPKLFKRYIQNIKAWTTKEKLPNPITGRVEDPNEDMMQSIETKIGLSEDIAERLRQEHRYGICNKIAAWALKSDEYTNIPYERLFSEFITQLKVTNDKEHDFQLSRIKRFILQFDTEDWKLVPEEEKSLVKGTIDSLVPTLYSIVSLKEAVVFVLCHQEKEGNE